MVKTKFTQKVEHEVRFNHIQALWYKSDEKKNLEKKSKFRRFWKFSYFFEIFADSQTIINACIEASKCQKLAEHCLSLAKIGVLNLKKKLQKIAAKKFFWPIRPIFHAVSKNVIFTTLTNIQYPENSFKVPSVSTLKLWAHRSKPPL